MINIAGKIIIFFGGTGGIGQGICTYAHRNGAKVVIVGRDPKKLADFKAELGFANAIAVQADATDPKDVEKVFIITKEEFGRIDQVWISVGQDGSWEKSYETDPPEVLNALREKLSPFLLKAVETITPIATKVLLEQGHGILVNMSTHAVMKTEEELPGNWIYRELKAEAERTVDAARKSGVKTINLRPAIINTPSNAKHFKTEQDKLDAVQPEEMFIWVSEHAEDGDLPLNQYFDSKVVV